jgi:glucokinase
MSGAGGVTLVGMQGAGISRGDVLIGVDVGGTGLSGGLVTRAGEVLTAVQTATHVDGPGTVVATLLRVITGLQDEASRRGLVPQGVGIGLPGVIDPAAQPAIGLATLVPELSAQPVAERVRAATGLPTFVDNDVNALALAEWLFGRGRGAHSLVVLALGSGVGAGIVIDGRLVRGRGGFAGELGHVPIDFRGPRCICGGRGCLCLYLSGHALEETARRCAAEPAGACLRALAGGDPRAVRCADVFRAAADGDAAAAAIVDDACQALAAALGVIVNSINPEVVVVTGGLAAGFRPLADDVLRRAAQFALPPALAQTRVHVDGADKRQTVRGGAALVLYETARAEAGLTRLPAGA